jgi:hypothetical protein
MCIPNQSGYDELASDIVKEGHAIKTFDSKGDAAGAGHSTVGGFIGTAPTATTKARNHGGLDFLAVDCQRDP